MMERRRWHSHSYNAHNGGSHIHTGTAHREFSEAFGEIGRDRQNKVVIFTGAGDSWISTLTFPLWTTLLNLLVGMRSLTELASCSTIFLTSTFL